MRACGTALRTLVPLVTVGLCFASPSLADPVTWYVNATTGVDIDTPDTWGKDADHPFLTIAHAAGRLQNPGESIVVATGVYHESDIVPNVSGVAGTLVKLKAQSGHRPVLDGQGTDHPAVDLSGRSYVRVEGLEFRGYAGDAITVGSGCQIVGNYIHHCADYTDWGADAAIQVGNAQDALIENNEIAWCGGDGVHASAPESLADHVVIRGNNIHHVGGDGIQVGGSNILIERNRLWDSYWGWGHQDGVVLDSCHHVIIRYNTIGDFTQLVYGGLDDKSDASAQFHDIYIYGNVFYNSQYHNLYAGGCPGVFFGFGGFASALDVSGIQIHSNTFLFLGDKAIYLSGAPSADLTSLRIYNNIFYACRGLGDEGAARHWEGFASTSDVGCDYNCYYGYAYTYGDRASYLSYYEDPPEGLACDRHSLIVPHFAGGLVESYDLTGLLYPSLFNARLKEDYWQTASVPDPDHPGQFLQCELRTPHGTLSGAVHLPPHLDANSNPIFPGNDDDFQDMDGHLRDLTQDILMGAYTGERRVDVYDQNNFPRGAYPSISAAVTNSLTLSGYTVVVRPATYFEAVDFSSKNLTIKSSDPRDPGVVAATIINAQGAGTAVTLSADATDAHSSLEGLTIRGGATGGGGVLVRCRKTIVANCVIVDNDGPGIAEAPGLAGVSQSPLNIYNCVIADNTGDGVSIVGADRSIRDCTITGNDLTGITVANGGSVIAANSIVWGNSGTEQIHVHAPGDLTNINTDTDTDPKFGRVEGVGADPAIYPAYDYPLGLESPCIDSGSTTETDIAADALNLDNDDDLTEPVPLDIAGSSRIRGTAVDKGAYEMPHGRWIWTGAGSGDWQDPDSWRTEGLPDAATHDHPDTGMYPAYIDTGGTAMIGSPAAQAAALYLGSRPHTEGSAAIQSGGHLWLCHLELSGGLLSTGELSVASGGTLTAGTVRIGCGPLCCGGLLLEDGGTADTHIVHIGCSESGSGTLVIHGGTLNTDSVKVRPVTTNACDATLNGYGTINGPGGEATIVNNGRIQANGGGDDNTLAITGLTPQCLVTDQTEEPYGWYAIGRGRLEMPVTANSGDYVWGSTEWLEPRYYFNPVNSILIGAYGAAPGGSMTISLLATDRSEDPVQALGPVSLPIAVWEAQVSPTDPVPFTQADVAVRYDQTDARIGQSMDPACMEGDTPQEGWLALAQWVSPGQWAIIGRAGYSDPHTIQSSKPAVFSSSFTTAFAVVQAYPGDADLSGNIDVTDLLWLVAGYGYSQGDPSYEPAGDFNGDGTVDVTDLLILVDTYGTTYSQDTCGSRMSRASYENSEAVDLPGGTYSLEELQSMDVYDALEATGLLDVYLDYLAEHP